MWLGLDEDPLIASLIFFGDFFKKRHSRPDRIVHVASVDATDTKRMRATLKRVNAVMRYRGVSGEVLLEDLSSKLKALFQYDDERGL